MVVVAGHLEEHNCGVVFVETTRRVGSVAIVPRMWLCVATKQGENALNSIAREFTMV